MNHIKGLDVWTYDEFTANVNTITHSALHHADEVVATVMLAVLGEVDLYRTRDREFVQGLIGEDGILVLDIGGVYDHAQRAYDHHQNDPSLNRADGIKRAATGLIWSNYGDRIVCKLLGLDEDHLTETELQLVVNVYERLNDGFVRAIDAFDNGVENVEGDYGLSQMLPLFNVDWDGAPDDEAERSDLDDKAFLEACFVADKIFRRLVEKTAAMVRGEKVIDELIRTAESRVLVLPAPIDNWVKAVLRSKEPNAERILFAVYPARGGHWSVQALPPNEDFMFSQKLPFPEEWRGQPKSKLAFLTALSGVETVHPGGFFAACETKETAIALADLAIKKAGLDNTIGDPFDPIFRLFNTPPASPSANPPADPDKPASPPYTGANPT